MQTFMKDIIKVFECLSLRINVYIKNQIELTKQEVQEDLKDYRRKYQSVPRQRE